MIDTTPTTVTTRYIEDSCNFRIIFGDPIKIITDDSHSDTLLFSPGSIFGLDLFKRNNYGSTEWAVYVLQVAYPGETILPIPQVTPGAKILLEAHGKKRAQAALKELAEIQQRVDPTTLPPSRFLLTDFRLKADTRTRR